jgi:hypothetical protein
MSAVTLQDTDWKMIDSFAAAPRLIAEFNELMANDQDFRHMLTDFTALWPVLNVRSVRSKLGYDAFRQNDRATLLLSARLKM